MLVWKTFLDIFYCLVWRWQRSFKLLGKCFYFIFWKIFSWDIGSVPVFHLPLRSCCSVASDEKFVVIHMVVPSWCIIFSLNVFRNLCPYFWSSVVGLQFTRECSFFKLSWLEFSEFFNIGTWCFCQNWDVSYIISWNIFLFNYLFPLILRLQLQVQQALCIHGSTSTNSTSHHS